MEFDNYTFSEAITLANMFMSWSFKHDYPLNISTAEMASKWFIMAEEARENGTVRAYAHFRRNYL